MKLYLFFLAASVNVDVAGENPIRRVVTLLQQMGEKIEAEGEAQKDMFEKFVCYCETNTKSLAASVASLTEAVPQLEATIKSKVSVKAQLESELKVHKSDRASAESSISSATEQRAQEKAAFDAYSAEAKSNVEAMSKAVSALRTGMGEAFLQTTAANAVRQVATSVSLSRFDAEQLGLFLQGKTEGSGEIVGILEQMKEDLSADLKDSTDTEAAAVKEFDALVAAKEKQIAAATAAIEEKTSRLGTVAVEVVNAKQDLEDTQSSLAEDTGYLAELKKTCAEQAELFDIVQKTRGQELEAIGATVKILNSDDALDLFKKTLPSPGESFLQTTSKSSSKSRARALLRQAASVESSVFGKSTQLQLMTLALHGKKGGFGPVLKMMDEFVTLLGAEQDDDDSKVAYCKEELDKSSDKSKATKASMKALETEIAEGKEALAAIVEEIAALKQGIADLDKSVAEATQTRKDEHAAYESDKAQNSAAVELLGVAKNTLNKFYDPTLYVAPPKRELTEDERIFQASGGDLGPTAAPGGIAGTGVTVFAQLTLRGAPPPPPMSIEAYKKSDSAGPTALLDNLANDLKMEMQEDDHEEKTAQADYEEMMKQSANKRATDAKTITSKEVQKAKGEEALTKAKDSLKVESESLLALQQYIASLHADCDFLLESYEARKEARASEIESIKKAKAVLSGADYSFLQVASSTHPGFLQKHKDSCPDEGKYRLAFAQKLTQMARDVNEACVTMCKKVNAFPHCDCPDFEHDSTPGVMTWDELYDKFDQLKESGREMLKQHAADQAR